MKKALFIAACSLIAMQGFSQQKKTTHVAKSPLSAEKTKMLCKPWKLDTIEQFGVVSPATAKEQNDGMTFLADSTFFITKEGVASFGKWKPLWGTTVSATFGTPATTMQFKILSLSEDRLVASYQTPDLITITYTYSAKKK